jgi:hypothetical protein
MLTVHEKMYTRDEVEKIIRELYIYAQVRDTNPYWFNEQEYVEYVLDGKWPERIDSKMDHQANQQISEVAKKKSVENQKRITSQSHGRGAIDPEQ